MTEPQKADLKKLQDAVLGISKILKCALCHKFPKETRATKCGHLFCKTCVDKVLNLKKANCSICKTVIIRSAIYQVESYDKAIQDFHTLCKTIEQDSNISIPWDKPRVMRQYQAKHKSVTLPGPSLNNKIGRGGSSSRSDLTAEKLEKQSNRRTSRVKKIARKESIDSIKTIKIQHKKLQTKSVKPPSAATSTSRVECDVSAPVFTTDNLSVEIGSIGYQEKVADWLNSEKFLDQTAGEEEFPAIEEPPGSNSPATSEILQSFSQLDSSKDGIRNERNSQASKSSQKNRHGSASTADNAAKYRSFTFKATDKIKKPVPKTVTPAEEMFDELCRKTIDEQANCKKSRRPSICTDSSWSELARFKKETHSKVRKRRRLNVSIERPNSTKPITESLNYEESKDENEIDGINDIQNGKNRSPNATKETRAVEESPNKRQKPSLISLRKLEENEMIDIQKLNRRQVIEIIGATGCQTNLDTSMDLSNGPNKSSVKSNKTKLSLERSGGLSRDNSNREEATSNLDDSSRPRSKQSFPPNYSRPNSRLSCKSIDKPTAEKIKLSKGSKSLTPNKRRLEISANTNTTQLREEEQEQIQLDGNSPVRACSNFVRNKLSLKKLSSNSSRTIDRDNRSSVNVSIKKLGKLYKPLNRIKFILLGSTISKVKKQELRTTTRDVTTQTSPGFAGLTSNNSSGKYLSSESMARVIVPETRTASAASNESRGIGETLLATTRNYSKTIGMHKVLKEFDITSKVNMLSPEKDSQLKYLATESPLSPRMNCLKADDTVQRTGNPNTVVRETSFINSTSIEEYSKAIKNFAEKLIVTDSEDQDMPSESCSKIERKNNRELEKIGSDQTILSATTSVISKTTSSLSDMRMHKEMETARSIDILNINKSRSPHSIRNDSEEKLSYASPEIKKYSRDSFRSQTKKRSAEKLNSLAELNGSYCDESPESDAETVLPQKTKSKNSTQPLQDSETSMLGRHKVVRKLKYSQETGSNPNTESGRSETSGTQLTSHTEKKSNRVLEKKAFQRIHAISSTDSEDEPLQISLMTKQSSSNSQTITRLRPSQVVNRSPMLSEDITIIFSSNKDSQESKRKRSPSPHLDNKDLQAIASNWCTDLDRSFHEIAVDTDKILGISEDLYLNEVAPKKPRVEPQRSPAPSSSDKYLALSPTAMRGCRRNSNDNGTTAMEIHSYSLNNEESQLIDDLDKVAREFDDGVSSKNTNLPAYDTRNISLAANAERSIKRTNTFNGVVSTSKNSTPVKAKSLENKNTSVIQQFSQNSDKENDTRSQGVARRSESKRVLTNTGQKMALNQSSDELQVSCKYSEKFDAHNVAKSNCKNIPNKVNPMNSTELFESSFDPDCLNITQEQMLMQELEENLLGRKSKDTTKQNSQETRQEKRIEKSPSTKAGKTSTAKESSISSVNQKAKSYQIAQIDTDDSCAMDEDIIESTPEKNLALKKDLYAPTESSQRLNASLRSFMSVDMTPIPRKVPKRLHTTSDLSVLIEPNLNPLSDNLGVPRSHSVHLTCHSTPKSTTSLVSQQMNLQKKFSCVEKVTNRKRQLCFVCSCLTLPQVNNVKAFARKYNVEYTTNYKPEVTHVIVETNDRRSAGRTLKYLLGVAHQKWIVSYSWITDSVSQEKILEEEPYEAVDSDTEEPGPRRSRLREKGLFDAFAFVCMKPFSDITIEQLQDLVISTGGMVVQTLEDLASVDNKYRVILHKSELHDAAILDKWRKKGHALPVLVEWLLSCISQYELVSFRGYLQISDPELLSDLDLPAELITDIGDSYSISESSVSNIDD